MKPDFSWWNKSSPWVKAMMILALFAFGFQVGYFTGIKYPGVGSCLFALIVPLIPLGVAGLIAIIGDRS